MNIEDKACKHISSRWYKQEELRWALSVANKVLEGNGGFTNGQLRASCNLLQVERIKLKRWIDDGHKDWAYNRVQKTGCSLREIEVAMLGLIRRMMQLGNRTAGYEERQADIEAELKRRDYIDLAKANAHNASKFRI